MHRVLNRQFISRTSILRTPRLKPVTFPLNHITKMTTSNGNKPSKRPSSTDLSDRTSKKPHNENKSSSTSAKQNTNDPSQNHEKSESVEGIHEWKTRPPYQIHTKEEHFDARHDASCHCGKVKYQLSREEPLDSKLCHCTTCQTQHGMSSPFLPLPKMLREADSYLVQRRPSNGQQSSTKQTSTSHPATTV